MTRKKGMAGLSVVNGSKGSSGLAYLTRGKAERTGTIKSEESSEKLFSMYMNF